MSPRYVAVCGTSEADQAVTLSAAEARTEFRASPIPVAIAWDLAGLEVAEDAAQAVRRALA